MPRRPFVILSSIIFTIVRVYNNNNNNDSVYRVHLCGPLSVVTVNRRDGPTNTKLKYRVTLSSRTLNRCSVCTQIYYPFPRPSYGHIAERSRLFFGHRTNITCRVTFRNGYFRLIVRTCSRVRDITLFITSASKDFVFFSGHLYPSNVSYAFSNRPRTMDVGAV